MILIYPYFQGVTFLCQNFAEEERQKIEDAERKAKLDAIAERQRQRERELEEKEQLRREELLRKPTEPLPQPTGPASAPPEPVPAAAAGAAASPASTGGKYVPRYLRERSEGQRAAAAPPEPDRWGRKDDHPPQSGGGDRWTSENRRPSFGGPRMPSSSSWSRTRN